MRGRVQVCFERLLSMEHPQLLAQRITLQALDRDANVTLEIAVDGNNVHQTSGMCLWKETENADNQLTLTTGTTGIAVRYTLFTKCPGSQTIRRRHRLLVKRFAFKIAVRKSVSAQRIVCVDTAHPGEALPSVTEPLDFEALQQENRGSWGRFWQACDVRIEGDIANQQGIRYCLFQLHSTYRGLDTRNNIGAKGLTGEVYNGHAFWDTETYGLPFLPVQRSRRGQDIAALSLSNPPAGAGARERTWLKGCVLSHRYAGRHRGLYPVAAFLPPDAAVDRCGVRD